MLKIDWTKFIRSRQWFGFFYIVCEISDTREWGFRGEMFFGFDHKAKPFNKFYIIGLLNKYA